MIPWSKLKKATGVLGLVLFFLGSRYSIDVLIYASIVLVSGYFALYGIDTIINRRIRLEQARARFHLIRYLEWSDVAQGTLLILLSVLILGIAVTGFLGIAQGIFRYLVRHPSSVFFALSLFFFLYAVIKAIGTDNQPSNPQGGEWLTIFVSQILPAGFMILLALAFAGLGFLEFLAPDIFDRLGGSFIEIFFISW